MYPDLPPQPVMDSTDSDYHIIDSFLPSALIRFFQVMIPCTCYRILVVLVIMWTFITIKNQWCYCHDYAIDRIGI